MSARDGSDVDVASARRISTESQGTSGVNPDEISTEEYMHSRNECLLILGDLVKAQRLSNPFTPA
jgi:hypothetical protein